LYLNPKNWNAGHWWANLIGHQFAFKRKDRIQISLDAKNIGLNCANLEKKKGKVDEHLDLDEFPVNCNSKEGQKNSLALSDELSPSHSTSSNSSGEPEKRIRPTNLEIGNKRKEEKNKFSVERVRRWSVAPISSDVLVKSGNLSKKEKPKDGKRTENSVVAVRGIDFVQVYFLKFVFNLIYFVKIPIQMLTPSTIAIVDCEKNNEAEDSPDIERNIKRKITQ
jgi:hypothetical protein